MIKNPTLLLKYDLNISFIIFFIEKNKNRKLGFKKFGKKIGFILFDKFFDYYNCV